MTTLRDIIKITRPVSYDNNDENWPYTTRGSCVVVQCNNRLYIVTARHVVNGYKPSQILIPYEEGDCNFLPLQEAFIPITSEIEDTDHKDIILIEIPKQHLLPTGIKQTSIANITLDTHKKINNNTRYLVTGYPFCLNRVDYDKEIIWNQSSCIEARLLKSDVYIGVDKIEFKSDGGLESDSGMDGDDPFNGLSGGGIFSMTPNNRNQTIAFQGILLRATASSKIGYILKTDWIKQYILGQQKPAPITTP